MGRSGPCVYHCLFVSVGLLVCAALLCLPPACLTACLLWEKSGLGVPALNIHQFSPDVPFVGSLPRVAGAVFKFITSALNIG